MPVKLRPASLLPVLLVAMVATLVADVRPAQAFAPVDDVPPATIRVCRSSGGVQELPFEEYVRQVLPREFPSSWPMATLRAGAIAVKSYAWYYVEHPISAECDLGDSTRYQKFAPEDTRNPPTPKTDQAVRDTFHLRLEDPSGASLYAQYCSGGCRTHRRNAGEGRYLDQDEAARLGGEGWTATQMIAHFYRGMDATLFDWRAPFTLAAPRHVAYGDDEPAIDLAVPVGGIAPGDDRATATLVLYCTIDDVAGPHVLEQVGVTDVDGTPSLDFSATDRADACAEHEATVLVQLAVRGRLVRSAAVAADRPWTSSSPRDVSRVARTADPVAAGIVLSQALFDDPTAPPEEQQEESDPGLLGVIAAGDGDGGSEPDAEDPRHATHAVLVRDDVFADALTATALAGERAPILFNAGGPDATLDGDVATELERILPEGTVHVVGGPQAISDTVVADLRDRGFTVRRHFGTTRVETATAVADAVLVGGGDASIVMVARAWPNDSGGWADAIAAGGWAAATGHPILLTPTAELAPATADWIAAQPVGEAIVLGGPAAVSPAAAARLDVDTVTRIAGDARDGTAAEIARRLWSRDAAPAVNSAILMDIYDDAAWPFGLAGSVLAARAGAPSLAVDFTIPWDSTGAWLDQRDGLPVLIVGGERIVPSRIGADAAG